jgi:hypothetical protein
VLLAVILLGVSKRGEQVPASKDKNYTIDLSEFGKYLIAWYSSRP